jgi:hypothetical protein
MPAIAPPVKDNLLSVVGTTGGEMIEVTSTSALAELKLTESLAFRLDKIVALKALALVLIELPISDALDALSAWIREVTSTLAT